MILNYFSQDSDDIHQVVQIPPLILFDETQQIFTWPEIIFRAIGLSISAVGFVLGISLMTGNENLWSNLLSSSSSSSKTIR